MRWTTVALAALASTAGLASAGVVNGDFSAGNSGFTSAYNFTNVANGLSIFGEGYYSIATNAINTHSSFASFGDHTGGGNMMVVNGSIGSNMTVWQGTSTQAVTSGTSYCFTVWAASAYSASPALLNLSADINGTTADFQLTSTAGEWSSYTVNWVSNVTLPFATLRIVDLNQAYSGNDFAIDDLDFVTCIPLPTGAGIGLAGLAGLGAVRRRRVRVA